MPLAAGTRLGPCEILGLIGSGGMGEDYKARDARLGCTVAIKLLPTEVSADPERRAHGWMAERSRQDDSRALAARSRTRSRISKKKN
jgi:serine/threonine protein kinase